MVLVCKKCGKIFVNEGKEIQLHHFIPRGIGGTDKDGRKYLCIPCHHKIHELIIPVIYPYIIDDKPIQKINKTQYSPENKLGLMWHHVINQNSARAAIKKYTMEWLGIKE